MLKDQVCLVTGASRGIGKAIALAIAEQGGIVFGTATTESGAEKISEYLAASGNGGQGLMLNVTDPDSITQTIALIIEKYSTPTVLINNAGITRDNLLMRMKESEWDDIMDTNLKSVFRLSKACLRGMTKARTGRVINIASVVGVTGNAGQSNYAAAKAGLIGFSKSLAQEVASRNITVNTIAPGFIATDMTNALADQQKEALLQHIPLGKMGTPEDIANAVVFLASSMGEYITGSTIHVNGGMHMV
ncbi:MAG: 3-oxoacyl-ACP reductase FabG [Gammaproteobacteria bacterium]|nr:3-oxoacyl-ACP reductase FabG [Gammaproteobacteria bacterium]